MEQVNWQNLSLWRRLLSTMQLGLGVTIGKRPSAPPPATRERRVSLVRALPYKLSSFRKFPSNKLLFDGQGSSKYQLSIFNGSFDRIWMRMLVPVFIEDIPDTRSSHIPVLRSFHKSRNYSPLILYWSSQCLAFQTCCQAARLQAFQPQDRARWLAEGTTICNIAERLRAFQPPDRARWLAEGTTICKISERLRAFQPQDRARWLAEGTTIHKIAL